MSSSFRAFYCLPLFQCVHDYECGTQVKKRKKRLEGKEVNQLFLECLPSFKKPALIVNGIKVGLG